MKWQTYFVLSIFVKFSTIFEIINNFLENENLHNIDS
jgi:hypothetical protein